jgi:predicted regulator of Ras-like GTPase activity (Roadblock/LC7/MglB family)
MFFDNTMKMHKTSCMVELNKILVSMNQEGGFSITLITDAQGLPIVSAALNGYDPDRQSAVAALIQKAAVQGTRQLGWEATDEVSLHQANGKVLICRSFHAGDQDLILAIVLSSRQQRYRRVTSSGIAQIKQVWSQYLE